MPQVPIIMPQLGESIAEATIVDIKVKPGDEVAVDQEIIDVETNKAVMGVTTPCKGKIDKIMAQLKETYPIGSVLGYVEASEADAARFTKQTPPQAQTEVAEEIPARADQEVKPARQGSIGHSRGRGGRNAAQLDTATLDGWVVGESRPRSARSTTSSRSGGRRSEAWPRTLCDARACSCPCGKSDRGRETDWQSRCGVQLD